MMILFFGLWSGGSVGRADGMILVVSRIFWDLKKCGGICYGTIFSWDNIFIFIGDQKERTNLQDSICPFLLAGYLFVMVME